MAKFTQTLELNHLDWIELNPNGEATVILQGDSVRGVHIVLADAAADIGAEEGHTLSVETGLGTAFYNLTTKVWARAVARERQKVILTVTAY